MGETNETDKSAKSLYNDTSTGNHAAGEIGDRRRRKQRDWSDARDRFVGMATRTYVGRLDLQQQLY
ncbi:hypothetical protein PCANC_14676 [Puccinia coronata f. sp. avenae]|uniref:Uncharacterized protein n=1 Tax=Puccinia coronata f. sp. avenae TaxID=200324 RepID=A0A2N5SG39_9BASI|nr:hypothetical protein PCANC_17004 [Puccinia coronata f. sp. avenae]PLW35448.1 hypothetical protein PCANC_14676 [Puccinia coronata f. sp. avenae]